MGDPPSSKSSTQNAPSVSKRMPRLLKKSSSLKIPKHLRFAQKEDESSAKIPRELVPPKRIREKIPDWKLRVSQPQVLARYGVYRARLEKERWIRDRTYYRRSTCAWFVVFFLSFVTAIGSMTNAVQFGNNQTTQMLIAWGIAVCWCFFVVEPFQVVLVALLPF